MCLHWFSWKHLESCKYIMYKFTNFQNGVCGYFLLKNWAICIVKVLFDLYASLSQINGAKAKAKRKKLINNWNLRYRYFLIHTIFAHREVVGTAVATDTKYKVPSAKALLIGQLIILQVWSNLLRHWLRHSTWIFFK